VLALHGLPALHFLHTNDPEVRMMLTALANRAAHLDDLRQQNLARHVVAELAKAMRRRG
jgi:hypothetical protein